MFPFLQGSLTQIAQPYGLGFINTTYPISAFITHLVYLKGSTIKVDEALVTVGANFLHVLIHAYCILVDLGSKVSPNRRL